MDEKRNNKDLRPEPLTYNLKGFEPIYSGFRITTDQFRNFVMEVANNEIGGAKAVSIEHNKETGKVGVFIWFDSNSTHFIDNGTQNSMLNTGLRRNSPQFEAFAEKFGWSESDDDPEHGSTKVRMKSIMVNNQDWNYKDPVIGMRVGVYKFLFLLFDVYGKAYNNEFHASSPKMRIWYRWEFRGGESGKYQNLIALTVEKSLAKMPFADSKTPKATKSKNF